MSKFDKTITSIQKDLTPLNLPRDQYLALCAKDRMLQNLDKYNRNFDKLLNTLEKESVYEKDLTKLLKTIQAFSALIDHTYANLLKSIQNQQEIFYKLNKD